MKYKRKNTACSTNRKVVTSVIAVQVTSLLLSLTEFKAARNNFTIEGIDLSMDEGRERDKTSMGGGLPTLLVSTSVQFSLRNEGSSEYLCVCEGRESLRPNF